MILLIIKSYLTILISIGAGSLFIFFVGLYFILKNSSSNKINLNNNKNNNKNKNVKVELENANDLIAIAGDDVIATQLDLARAYIETGKSKLAKEILMSVASKGSAAQQQEAQQLMSYVC